MKQEITILVELSGSIKIVLKQNKNVLKISVNSCN